MTRARSNAGASAADDRVAIGIDLGTSSIKATALRGGAIIDTVSMAYTTSHPSAGRSEQDPEDWWHVLGAVLTDLAGAVAPSTCAAVGLTGQMHTSVLRDERGQPVRPAILWSDERAAVEAAGLLDTVPEWAAIAGNHPIPAFTVAHLAWLAQHEPDVLRRTATVTLVKDYIRERLGGDRLTEPSDASGTGLLNFATDEWSSALLSAARVERSWLGDVVPSHSPAGEIRCLPDGASSLLGARLVAGAGDQAAQAIALGVVRDGDIGVSVGSSGAAFGALSSPRPGSYRHALPSSWLALDSVHAAGTALRWWSDLANLPLTRMGALDPRGPAPLFLPHLHGHRDRAGAPGTLANLRIEHDKEDIAYAVVEGVAIALARLVQNVGSGSLPAEIPIGGRGGQLPLLRVLLATLLDTPVVHSPRGPAYGAAVMAAQAEGWDDLITPQGSTTRSEPDHALSALLLDRAGQYAALDTRLTPA